ncbi:hypothetical protein UC34_09885 [Pandoraea vervacti]|uniref:Uncharacterized protein n=2 Tax=Pandoraea vervacti TaxID=656178 RepID=A0ABM5SXJ3_9BURK|nr:hypothetical protein UC34_09885 [Pandoraea vervacti]
MIRSFRLFHTVCIVGVAGLMAMASASSHAASAVAGVRSVSGMQYLFVMNQTSMAKAKVSTRQSHLVFYSLA